MGVARNRGNWVVIALFAALGALAIAPAAHAASCGGKKATIKPKAKSGKTKKLSGTNGDDVIVSEGGKQKIKAKGGNDIICSGKGGDKINGGDGDDIIFGGGGGDKIDGGGGNDTIHGEHGGDKITGNIGDDTVTGDDGGDKMLDGSEGNDLVNGNDGSDAATGGGGTDTLLGDRGADNLDGGPGDGDIVLAGIDNDKNVSGGDGDKDIVSGESGDDDGVSGGAGNGDMVDGGFGNDDVDGGAGDADVVNGGNGNDKLGGGAGDHDIVSYVDTTPAEGAGNHGVSVNLTQGGASGEGNDSLNGFEDAIGSAFEDTLIGNSASSRLDGFLGMDSCSNGNPNQFISCNETQPTPVCNTTCVDMDPNRLDGVPHLVVLGTGGSNAITVDFAGGAFVITDTSAGIRALTGCTGSVVAVGNTARCPVPPMPDRGLVYGGDGDDSISLTPSVPTTMPYKLNGATGNDNVTGGPGNDLVDGGTSGADALNGGPGSDVLNSRQGTDQMHGGDGEDLLETSSPCDGHLFDGGGGTDNAAFAPSFGFNVTATIGGVATDKGKPGCNPSQINSSNEYLEGGPGDDTLIGDNSNNSLLGRAGKDTMMGMGGNDTINGLEGADTFLGGGGKDEMRAQDGGRDEKIDCGPPKATELALVDGADPKTIGCKAKKKGKRSPRRGKKK